MTPTQLGAILKAARKAQGLTQSALATRIGLSQSRASYLEMNAAELSANQLLAWCAVLGLELSIGRRDESAATALAKADW